MFKFGQSLSQALHLVGCFRVLEFQIIQILHKPVDFTGQPVSRIVQAFAHLFLNLFSICKFLLGSIGNLILGLGQRSLGFVHRPVRLLLHGQNTLGFFANLATLIFHLAGRFLSGDHSQANLPTLTNIWAIGCLKVIGFNQ